MKTGTTIFAAFFIWIGGIVVGAEIGWRQRESEPDKIVTLTKTCPDPQRFVPKWDCGAAEARTYCTTCLKRRWL